jgi:ribonuclease D
MADLLQLSFPKSKSITTSNWAAQELTPNQLRYAANDAYAALKIMEALNLDLTNLPKEPAPRERKPQAHRRRRHTTKRTPPQA